MSSARYDAIVLLGFGGPERAEEVRPFLDRVLRGRPVPPARYESVVEHYLLLGGSSPYNELTRRQAAALSASLQSRGINTPVELAFRNAEPFIDDVIERLSSGGGKRLFGIVLAPHQSAASWDKYVSAADAASERLGAAAPQIEYIAPFFEDPRFIAAHAERLHEAARRLGHDTVAQTHVIFTAHSIPHATPGVETYVAQFTRSAELIAAEAGLKSWSIAYQSRSGSPKEPWLEPDVRDEIVRLREAGVEEAIMSPIGFLIDHVEVLYDLDIDAKAVAQERGLRVERAEALNDHPLFVEMLAEAVACA